MELQRERMAGNFREGNLSHIAIGQYYLRAFCGFFKPLPRYRIVTSRLRQQVHPKASFKLLSNPGDDGVIKVIATKLGVPSYGTYLELIALDLQDRDVKGAS